MRGHVLRRGVHLGMVYPYLYFAHGESVAEAVGLELPKSSPAWCCSPSCSKGCVCSSWSSGRTTRLAVSALAWGAVGVGFVLLLDPSRSLCVAAHCFTGMSDPPVGEPKGRRRPAGDDHATLLLLAIWLVSSFHPVRRCGSASCPCVRDLKWPRLRY